MYWLFFPHLRTVTMTPSQNHQRQFLFLMVMMIFSLCERRNQVTSFAIQSTSYTNHRHTRSSFRMFVDPLPVWRGVKGVLPPIVTGAYEKQTGEEYPGEALYNLVNSTLIPNP